MTHDADNPERKVLDRDFKYYIFDWDNNILHMPTQIHLERRRADGTWEPLSVSTSAFAVLRSDRENYRPPNGDWEQSFADFRDLENRPGVSACLPREGARSCAVQRRRISPAPGG